MTESEMAMSEMHGFTSARNEHQEPTELIGGTFDLRNLKINGDEGSILPPINIKDINSLDVDFMMQN